MNKFWYTNRIAKLAYALTVAALLLILGLIYFVRPLAPNLDWVGSCIYVNSEQMDVLGSNMKNAGRVRPRLNCYSPWYHDELVYIDVLESENRHTWFLWDRRNYKISQAADLIGFSRNVKLWKLGNTPVAPEVSVTRGKVNCREGGTTFTTNSGIWVNVFSKHH